MDLLQTLLTRRSPALPSLREPGPTPDQLTTILTIAARVPDHGKLAPWRFIVIEGDARNRLGAVIGSIWSAKNAPMQVEAPAAFAQGLAKWSSQLASAPLVVAVISTPKPNPKIPEWEQVLSCGAACMNMLLGAKALGFGAVWLSEWYAGELNVQAELAIAPHEKLAGFIHIGTPSEQREDRDRPNLASIVTRY